MDLLMGANSSGPICICASYTVLLQRPNSTLSPFTSSPLTIPMGLSIKKIKELLFLVAKVCTTNAHPSFSNISHDHIIGVLELTHNHGTESDPEFKGYASGNEDIGRGFGHIAITVDDIEKACARLEQLNVTFKKRPSDGTMKDIAFVLDPDGRVLSPFHRAHS